MLSRKPNNTNSSSFELRDNPEAAAVRAQRWQVVASSADEIYTFVQTNFPPENIPPAPVVSQPDFAPKQAEPTQPSLAPAAIISEISTSISMPQPDADQVARLERARQLANEARGGN